MTTPKPNITVRVDVANPGQFFACCGLLELAHRIKSETMGWFEDNEFRIANGSEGGTPCLTDILARLCQNKVGQVGSVREKALRPVRLEKFSLTLDWWTDAAGKKAALKMWAGQQTSSGIVEELRKAICGWDDASASQLFNVGKPLTGRFGVDPRAAWNALDTGFSPNEQAMAVTTYPAVELLAAVGLQRCRPVQTDDGAMRYCTWRIPLRAILSPVACAGILPAVHGQSYSFRICRRGSYKGFGPATPYRR